MVDGFGKRIAAVTLAVAQEWGRQAPSRSLPLIDGLIAATAAVHGWTLVTRNVKDFERAGVRLLNPFSGDG